MSSESAVKSGERRGSTFTPDQHVWRWFFLQKNPATNQEPFVYPVETAKGFSRTASVHFEPERPKISPLSRSHIWLDPDDFRNPSNSTSSLKKTTRPKPSNSLPKDARALVSFSSLGFYGIWMELDPAIPAGRMPRRICSGVIALRAGLDTARKEQRAALLVTQR